ERGATRLVVFRRLCTSLTRRPSRTSAPAPPAAAAPPVTSLAVPAYPRRPAVVTGVGGALLVACRVVCRIRCRPAGRDERSLERGVHATAWLAGALELRQVDAAADDLDGRRGDVERPRQERLL